MTSGDTGTVLITGPTSGLERALALEVAGQPESARRGTRDVPRARQEHIEGRRPGIRHKRARWASPTAQCEPRSER